MKALAIWMLLLFAPAAHAADRVAVGIGGSASDAPLFIARDMGFFAREGLDVDLITMDSGAKVIPSLGTGELDVGSGALSVGFYNAVTRGVHFRVVADRGHTDAVSLYQTVFMRKDLVESGTFKTLADLKGRRMGFAAAGVTTLSLLNEAAKAGGISYDDVGIVYLSFPEQAAAMRNKAIDGSLLPEPQATQLERAGVGVRVMNTNDFYPNQQITCLFYSENFATARTAIAQRFMRGWLAAVRAYTAALQGGRITGPGADTIIAVIAKELHMDPEIIGAIYAAPVDPDGRLNVESIRRDLTFFQSRGWVAPGLDLAAIIDESFADGASAALGKWQPPR